MRIVEIVDNFTKYAQKSMDNSLNFPDGVMKELSGMVEQMERLYTLTKRAVLEKEPMLLS